jgi:hypothetical protein
MPDRHDDFEDAWAKIVADLTSGEPTAQPRPDGAGPAGPATVGGEGLHALFEPLHRAHSQQEPGAEPGAESGAQGGGDPGRDPAAFVDNWEEEGHYAPPPPPDLPEGTPVTRLAWAGLLGGPSVLALTALTPWDPPGIVTISAALAALAGFATLVWQLPESREDGWDDGAQV